MTYNIRVTRPGPSIDQDRTVFQADTYQEAVAIAHQAYRSARRAITLGSGEYGMENWHHIDHSGVTTDRNTNSGVVPKAHVLELCEACDVLNGEVPGIPCTCGDDPCEIKRELFEKYIIGAGRNPVAIFEDRSRICRVWRELGYGNVLFDVGPGYEF